MLERTGRGSRVDISMLHSAVSWMATPVMLSHSFGLPVTRRGNTHPFFAPVSVFPASDGHVYLAVGNDRQWEALTRLPGFEALAREEYARNAGRIGDVERLTREVAAITRDLSVQELINAFQGIGVPVSKVYTVAEVAKDPLIAGRMVRAQDARSGIEICVPAPPVIPGYLRHSGMTLRFPPRLGEHNQEILGALGCDLQELRAQGIL
jgi:formyl-CoA transferase